MIIQLDRHPKGWGHEDWIINTEKYCAKILWVMAGKKCSLHYHKIKTETMLVAKGSILMTFGDSPANLKEITLVSGQAFHIEPFLLHQFTALEDSEIHEFSTQHFESDSVRVVKGD